MSIGGEGAGLGGQHPLLCGREGPLAQAGLGGVCRAGGRGAGGRSPAGFARLSTLARRRIHSRPVNLLTN